MTSTMTDSGLEVINYGKPKPKVGMEKGTVFDYIAGDLVFPYAPGEDPNEGLVYDWREPTVNQLKTMLDRDGRARSLEQCLIMPISGASWHLEGTDETLDEEVEGMLRESRLNGGMKTPMTDIIAQKAEALVF